MKNKFYIIIFLAIMITIVGCQVTVGEKEELGMNTISQDGVPKISDYYPFLKNTILEYKGEGIEYAEQTVYYEFIEENKAQQKVMNSGTNLIRILENDDGALTEVYVEGEFYHIENMLNAKKDKTNIILKEPLDVGNTWLSKDGNKKEITGLDINIETPYKSFKALEVTTDLGEGNIQKDYFVKDIGLVAKIFNFGDHQVKTLLKSMREQPLEQKLLVYYPMYSEVNTSYIEDKISFYTNQSIEKLIENKLKNPPSDKLIAPLPKETVINSIHFDRSSWVLNVDISEGFLTELNAGSTLEYEVIRSIVNTFGKFYDTDKVYISLNGKPYESGHMAINEEEYFKVNTEGIEKFK